MQLPILPNCRPTENFARPTMPNRRPTGGFGRPTGGKSRPTGHFFGGAQLPPYTPLAVGHCRALPKGTPAGPLLKDYKRRERRCA